MIPWRRHLVSFVLCLLSAGLGIYLFVVDRGGLTTGEAAARKRNLFQAFRRGEISEIAIESPERGSFRLVRRAGDAGHGLYFLVRPGIDEMADQSAVDKLLSDLEFATRERRVDGADLSALGLDAPRFRLTISMGEITYHLAVGRAAPAPARSAYAELAGEGIFVVSRELLSALEETSDAYRARALIPYLSSALREFQLDGPGGARRFARASGGGFAIATDRGSVRVDHDAFDRILGAFADVRSEAFLADDEAERMLADAPDKLRIELVPENGTQPKAILEIGRACPGHPDDVIAIRREPAPRISACVPKTVLEPLSMPIDRLVDLRLFSLRPDEMEEIALVSGDKKLDLVRKGTAWHLREPSEATVDIETGNGVALGLSKLIAEEIVAKPAPETAGLSAPRITAKVFRVSEAVDAGTAAETVELWGEGAGGSVLARRAADGAWLRLSSDTARALVPTAASVKSRKVVDTATAKVRRIAIEHDALRQSLRRSAAGAWTLEEPKGFEVDAGLAGDLADAMAGLRAERWVADRDDGHQGLATPRGHVEIEIDAADAAASIVRIELGNATSGGVFARRVGDPAIFVLPEATLRTLDTWAIDRSCFALTGALSGIRMKRGPSTVSLAAADGGERFARVKNALADLRAEAAVHLGPARKEEKLDRPELEIAIDSGSGAPVRLLVGAGDAWRGTNVRYARREGVDATFVIADSKVRPLLDMK